MSIKKQKSVTFPLVFLRFWTTTRRSQSRISFNKHTHMDFFCVSNAGAWKMCRAWLSRQVVSKSIAHPWNGMDNNNNSSSKKTGTSKRKKKNPFRVMAFVWISLLLFFCHLLCNPVCADSWWSLGRAQHTHLRRHLFFFNRKWEKGNLILLVSNAEKWIYLNNNNYFFIFIFFVV